MKRQVDREQKISAFEIDLGDLEALIKRLINLFDDESKVYCRIDIPLKKEQLTFDSVKDIKSYDSLKGKVNKFSIIVSEYGGNRKIFIYCYGSISPNIIANVTAESEVWCAGAMETIVTFLYSRRVWYDWLINFPFFNIGLFTLLTPLLLKQFFHIDLLINKPLTYSLISISIVFMIFSMKRNDLLPAATIKITNEDGFLKRRSSELTLLFSIIALLFTVIGWFVGK